MTSRKNHSRRVVGGDEELDRAGADVAGRPGERDGGGAELGAQLRRDDRARGSPRRPSGDGAGGCTPARRGGRRCRGCRRATGPRRGGRGGRSARPAACRRRTRRWPRGAPRRARRAARRARETIRIPRPPPPAAALTISGRRAGSSAANAAISSSLRPARRSPGRTGTPAASAMSLAAALSPSASVAAGGGPTNTIPARSQARGELRVLREEPVAGVDRLGAGRHRRVDQRARSTDRSRPRAPARAGRRRRRARRAARRRRRRSRRRSCEPRAGRASGSRGPRSRRGWRPGPTYPFSGPKLPSDLALSSLAKPPVIRVRRRSCGRRRGPRS